MGCASSSQSTADGSIAGGFGSSVVPHRRSSDTDSCRSTADPTPRVSKNGSFNIDDGCDGAAVFVRRAIYPSHSFVSTSSGGTFSPPPAAVGRNRRRDPRSSISSNGVGQQSPPPQRRQSLSLHSASDFSTNSGSALTSHTRWSGVEAGGTTWQAGPIGAGRDSNDPLSGGNTTTSSHVGVPFVGSDVDVMDLESSEASSSFTSICYSDGVAHSNYARHPVAPHPLLKLDGSSRTVDLPGPLDETPGEYAYDSAQILDPRENERRAETASSDGLDSLTLRNQTTTLTSFSDGTCPAGSLTTTILPPPGINRGGSNHTEHQHLPQLPLLPDVSDIMDLE